MNLDSCLATQTLQKAVYNLCVTIIFTIFFDGAASKRQPMQDEILLQNIRSVICNKQLHDH